MDAFFVVHDCLDIGRCTRFVAEHQANPRKPAISEQDASFSHRVLFHRDMSHWTQAEIGQIALEVAAVFQRRFHQTIWPETVSIVRWDDGHEMALHQDGQQPHTSHRSHAALIYLTDNESGEIYFPDRNQTFKPRQGLLIGFDNTVVHGVRLITDGPRYTLSMWFTDQRAHAQIIPAVVDQ
jgi:hypothetical protein